MAASLPFMKRSLLLVAAFLAALPCIAKVGDDSLIGCWRSTRIAQFVDGQPALEDRSGRCTLQFKATEFESRCQGASGLLVVTYSYHVERPNAYAAKMVSSTASSSLIGTTRDYEYRVQADHLQLVTYPQGTKPQPAAKVTRVVSESTRVPCP